MFKYNLDFNTNINKFKNDLYIYLNLNVDSDYLIFKYTEEFIEYFNKIYNLVINFENEIKNLLYEYIFEISWFNLKPNIFLVELNLINNNTYLITNITNQIKQIDYINLIKVLDYNYLIEINTNPYFIFNIKRINQYIQINNFYKGKYILLILQDLDNEDKNKFKQIEINFDTNMIYFIEYDINNDEEIFDNYTFELYNYKLIVHNGPIIDIKKVFNEKDKVLLNNNLYLIDNESTVNIFDFINHPN